MKSLNASLGIMLSLALSLDPLAPHATAQAGAAEWSEIKSSHFILHYQGGNRNVPELVLKYAESYYDEIAKALGYTRRSDFWIWDNRCVIYLYETQNAFHEATKQPVWSNSFAIPQKRTIVSFQGSEKLLDSVLPHELAHLIFRDLVGGRQTIPLWMDEGLAMAQEKKKRAHFDQLVKQMILEKRWIPFETLTQIHSVNATSLDQAALFYAESQSLVRFLLEAGESNRFVQLCRGLRDGDSFERGLQKNYPKVFRSAQELETKWLRAHA